MNLEHLLIRCACGCGRVVRKPDGKFHGRECGNRDHGRRRKGTKRKLVHQYKVGKGRDVGEGRYRAGR